MRLLVDEVDSTGEVSMSERIRFNAAEETISVES